MRQKPKNHNFRGKKYKIFFRPPKNMNHIGPCDFGTREIEIKPSLKGKEKLDCIIHEALHACLPDLDDDAVNETGIAVSGLLFKLGYVLKEERNK